MDVWHRVPVRDCVLVQGTVVTALTPISRDFLGNHVERRGPGTGRGLDDAQLEHVVEFPLGRFEAIRCQTSGACRDRGSNSLNVVDDIVLDWGVWGRYLCNGWKLR